MPMGPDTIPKAAGAATGAVTESPSAVAFDALTTEVLFFFLAAFAITGVVIFLLKSCRGGARPKAPLAPKSKPPKLFLLTAELRRFNGEDDSLPVYVAINGQIFDVSSRRDIYGKGGGYNLFAGYDASRALAKSSFENADIENPSTADLSFMERDTLSHWEQTFSQKYDVVGEVVADERTKQEKTAQEKAKREAADSKASAAKAM